MPLVVALGLVIAGAVQLAMNPPIPAFADGWFERDEARMHGWAMIAFGGLVLVIAINLWVKKAKRLKIPDDVRRLNKLERKRRAGDISEAEYHDQRAKLLDTSPD